MKNSKCAHKKKSRYVQYNNNKSGWAHKKKIDVLIRKGRCS